MGRLESLAGTMSVEVENIEEIAPDAVDADPIAQAQLEMQQVMAERLEGIFNFTKGTDTKLHSMHYDSMINRKNQATLEEIRDAIRDEMDAIAMKLEQPEEDADKMDGSPLEISDTIYTSFVVVTLGCFGISEAGKAFGK